MNYYQIIKLFKERSLKHPFVNSFYTDIYSVTGRESDINYPAIIITPNEFVINNPISTFNFNILYVDRMTEDRLNSIEIQSTGIQTINEIINTFELDNSFTINIFKDQFADLCAGAVANIELIVRNPVGYCYEENENDCLKNCE